MKYKIFILFFIIQNISAQKINPLVTKDEQEQKKWVENTYKNMSLDEKIGQLFMISVFSSQIGTKNTEYIKELIKKYHIGGIIFSKGGPKRQAKITNEYQSLSKIPLFMAMDAEWGLAMRLDSTFAYPWNMTMGAVKNNELIERAGFRIGEHCRQLGMQFNFAPDIDVNTNPANPIIGNRSFGEDKQNVALKGIAFTKGMQSAGVLGSAKHFPGHGDTSKDSHKTLPLIDFPSERLHEIEMYPFRELINNGVASVMVGHLNIPSLESKVGLPSSLSHHIITDILKTQMGFEGLVYTDALGMKGVSEYLPVGEVEVAAFLAGNDILLMPENLVKGFEAIKKAYQNKKITEERLAYSVKKILMAKYKVGLYKFELLNLETLHQNLHTLEDDLLLEEIFENALTVAKNENKLLPIRNLDKEKIAYIKFGNDSGWTFYTNLRKYADVAIIEPKSTEQLLKNIEPYQTIVIGLHKPNKTPWDAYKFTKEELIWLEEIAKKKKVILSIFTRPYALLDVKNLTNIESIIVSYQNHKVAQEKTAQLIFGAIEGKGVLPVSAHPELPVNTSVSTPKIGRLSYGLPESVGLSSKKLSSIDSIAQVVLNKRMAPGMQILVAKQGKIVYRKNFGTLDYNEKNLVKDNSIYDLASLTKILVTLPELMKIYAQEGFNINSSFSDLLPELRNTNKGNLKMMNVLSHYAQFPSWIPFYLKTLDVQKKPLKEIYSNVKTDDFSVQVAKNLYIKKDYHNFIYQQIDDCNLIKRKKYLYSDLPYYYFKKYIEKKSNSSLSEAIQKDFYRNMGAYHLTYFPLEHFPLGNIAPSEVDNYFRRQEIRGYVHDQGAAMLGGVGGHAGLFGNADDVAKMMQMFLQKGYYGGEWYLQPQIVNLFNTCMFCSENNRRGLGFDKPQIDGEGPTCGCVPMSSFGHTGFTGTYAWADPDNEIVIVFLSNRTFPTAENNLLIKENIRPKIQRIVYNAIIN
ncbi:glycoside hydrolase family 3 N-terminal domain-containing protein [Capnocytophaga cynodegmi]|uniref:beta-N-acetylhexosaminidase n=1 Tax=Capnocytophaga cynodegmi TaxID=28189 RepID=A0A0B7HG16_9FLAO|nr:glycoside hydrolase family 3 N-terminal domain-containing protein [Capnocytophaga cynodegmi]CEN36817.1 Undefined Glycoside hydrolase [Capnocytophaga cynodegmi]CEN41060.1 Undefined Glycoside hydrolase [Capnocytophaga cynodegmi]